MSLTMHIYRGSVFMAGAFVFDAVYSSTRQNFPHPYDKIARLFWSLIGGCFASFPIFVRPLLSPLKGTEGIAGIVIKKIIPECLLAGMFIMIGLITIPLLIIGLGANRAN